MSLDDYAYELEMRSNTRREAIRADFFEYVTIETLRSKRSFSQCFKDAVELLLSTEDAVDPGPEIRRNEFIVEYGEWAVEEFERIRDKLDY